MYGSRYLQLCFLCAMLACCTSEKASSPTVIADIPENRRHAAEEYLRVVPPADLMKDTAAKVGETMPNSVRQSFVRAMTDDLDLEQVKDAMVHSMVKHFTVGEDQRTHRVLWVRGRQIRHEEVWAIHGRRNAGCSGGN